MQDCREEGKKTEVNGNKGLPPELQSRNGLAETRCGDDVWRVKNDGKYDEHMSEMHLKASDGTEFDANHHGDTFPEGVARRTTRDTREVRSPLRRQNRWDENCRTIWSVPGRYLPMADSVETRNKNKTTV